MYFDVEQHATYQIANAPVLEFPFPHFYVRDVFPAGFYSELRHRLSELGGYKRLDETGTVPRGAYPERFVRSLEELERVEEEDVVTGEEFWAPFRRWLLGDRFERLITHKFRAGLTQRFGSEVELRTSRDARLVRDISNYAISPHTDTPRKLVSLLFYLPGDDSLAPFGTSIYAPNDLGTRCDGTRHHEFHDFKKVISMPYLPNTLFAFVKNDRAFHGLDRIERDRVVRDSLLYNIYVQKIVSDHPPQKPKQTTWPWETT